MFRRFINLFISKKSKREESFEKITPEKNPEKWIADPSSTQIKILITHMGLMEIEAMFTKFNIEVEGSFPHFKDIKVKAVIDPASFSTGVDGRDAHIKGPDFLDVEKYPEIKFVSTNIQWKPVNKLIVEGDLTIKGITKPVTLEAEILKTISQDIFGVRRAAIKVEGTINRKDFNVVWTKEQEMANKEVKQVLGDEVKLIANVELTEPKILEIYASMEN